MYEQHSFSITLGCYELTEIYLTHCFLKPVIEEVTDICGPLIVLDMFLQVQNQTM